MTFISFKLLDWIDESLLYNFNLSKNPNAVEYLKKNQHRINWAALSTNPNAIKLLKLYPYRIDWCALSQNPGAISMLKKNRSKISWQNLRLNPNPDAISILKKDKSSNIIPIQFLMDDWYSLSKPTQIKSIGIIYPKIQMLFHY